MLAAIGIRNYLQTKKGTEDIKLFVQVQDYHYKVKKLPSPFLGSLTRFVQEVLKAAKIDNVGCTKELSLVCYPQIVYLPHLIRI